MTRKLITLGAYDNAPRGLHYQPGQEFEADDALYLFLMADAPGCFEPAEDRPAPVATAALDAPPADKMLRAPKVKK